jgi:hypothetical protein
VNSVHTQYHAYAASICSSGELYFPNSFNDSKIRILIIQILMARILKVSIHLVGLVGFSVLPIGDVASSEAVIQLPP